MSNKLILGRYIPGDSIIHRLDPRAKLVGIFYFIIIVFMANSWASYAWSLAFLALCVYLSKVSVSFFLKGLKPLFWVIMFTVALQIFFTRGGDVLWSWGFLQITAGGLTNAVYIFMRFILIISMSTVLTLTTAPLALADALESLMQPLKAFHFPAHEISLMLSIALRFVPTLMDETEKIMNAQRSRGVDFDEGGLIQKIRAIIPLLIPLFVSSFNRAEELATAMEARGYQGGEGRTRYRLLEWDKRDTGLVIILLVYTLGLFFLRN